jgi:hypothetical protein
MISVHQETKTGQAPEVQVAVILATWKAEIGRIMVWGQPGQILFKTPLSKNNQVKMDWRCGSSSRMPALQTQSPEFKSQSHAKNKQKQKKPTKKPQTTESVI